MSDGDDSDYFVTFDGRLVLPSRVQGDVDAVVGAFHRGEASEDAFHRLAEWIDEHADDVLLQYESSFQALSPDAVREAFEASDDEDVAEYLGLAESGSVTDAHRVAYLEQRDFARLFEDSDIAYGLVPFRAVATDGAEAVLVRSVRGYSFSGITTECFGPYASVEAFARALAADGWVIDVEEFSARPLEDKLRQLHGAPPNRAG